MPPGGSLMDEPLQIADDASESSDLDDGTKSLWKDERSQADDSLNDSPERLVRHETRAVGIFRVVLLLVLVASAVVTSVFIHNFTSDSEEDSFEAEFEGVASRLVDGMTSDVSLKLWVGRTISSAITMAMKTSGATKLNLTMPADLWDQLTQEARFNANILFVSWSPILSTDEERLEFESFAKTQVLTTGANPPCFLCGEESQGYINPEEIGELPGFGLFPCGGMDEISRKGVFPEENCIPISMALGLKCKCGVLPPELSYPTNEVYIPEEMFKITPDGVSVPESAGLAPYQAIWQSAMVNSPKIPVLYNEMSEPVRQAAILQMMESSTPIMSETHFRTGAFYEEYSGEPNEPSVIIYYPVFAPGGSGAVVGSVMMETLWPRFLSAVYPPLSDLVDLVIENSCGQNYTYKVDLSNDILTVVGEGDLHDPRLSHMVHSSTFEEHEQIVNLAATINKNQSTLEYCRYRFHVFATAQFEDKYVSNDPYIYAALAAAIFIFTSLVFIFYDLIVFRRQSKVMVAATRTNDIVTDLFPREVRDRLFDRTAEQHNTNNMSSRSTFLAQPTKAQMQDFLSSEAPNEFLVSEPIADFFPHATVMFLDIAGFTAWSSEREPSQVFRLLETIYQSFDDIAKSLGVFKVETIGDSYVAVCGLPSPRKQHAIIMAQFAKLCLRKMIRLTRDLEKYLGPNTAELKARVGLHSGPVTAGVLRGEKARFQLFGDSVNTAARLESTGGIHRIHASKETADILVAAGKGSWVQPRRDLVHMKGKGDLQTYWISPQYNYRGNVSSCASRSNDSTDNDESRRDYGVLVPGYWDTRAKELRKKNLRLVDWNVETLYALLMNVVASREERIQNSGGPSQPASLQDAEQRLKEHSDGKIVIDEMTQILTLPKFHKNKLLPELSFVEAVVKEQLHDFVTQISNLYRDVPFHNFEHASHVIMSASKLMKRIVNPDGVSFVDADEDAARDIHSQTYGICSDRLMQFSVVFSALIHDVDHTGLTNAELNKMEAPVAKTYRNKSVAEQNSVDLAWSVLMQDRFKDLRACIYTNETELRRFRQLIVNAVMATDIADKELKTLRESRWDDAFSESAPEAPAPESPLDTDQLDVDRKATIVFEYIIQASDVAHTMQHWHTYQKFNRRLFEERYLAWKKGHAGEKDPSGGWYKGELWFFDNYIIPLARKLDKCGVFGVSYDEYLNYAKENRKEWVMKGEGIVAELLEACRERLDAVEIDEESEENFADDEQVAAA